ncbi:MAG: hypothetical protein IBX68_05420 [Dehalococcoidia bacterium]|nr:hypothetical protein [Dehalococcoidia bacterium]
MASTGEAQNGTQELTGLLQALLMPGAYPHKPGKVDLIQTQISAVFLAGQYVYKIKKPVDFGFLDFTTLEKRRYYCQQELILNRRLCPDTYLDVVPVTRVGNEYKVEGSGPAVEYAVKMLPLPHERMMDRLLEKGEITPAMVTRLAGKLVDFHERSGLSPDKAGIGGLDTVMQNTEENFDQVEGYINRTITRDQYDTTRIYAYSFLKKDSELFARRIREGRIKDCHGDLHLSHICFENDICIYDCIEFNDRFRYIDVASEVAFLAMDLDYHGRSDLAQRFVKDYVNASGDSEMLSLLNFYKCYRAYVRGKVEGFKLEDANIPQAEKSKTTAIARKYFGLAASYASQG